ncbi:MAG: hypothetical protein WC515_01095 [Candidatus Omnitrophota bacterium]
MYPITVKRETRSKGGFFARAVFFIGWILSPFTVWNDPLINIPISYISANIAARFMRADFTLVVVVFYWLSNVLGILLMYISGRALIRDRQHALRELFKLVVAVVVYSGLLVFLGRLGILKPFN